MDAHDAAKAPDLVDLGFCQEVAGVNQAHPPYLSCCLVRIRCEDRKKRGVLGTGYAAQGFRADSAGFQTLSGNGTLSPPGAVKRQNITAVRIQIELS